MRKEGQINPRIAVIVNESSSSSSSGDLRSGRRGEGERDVVGERVARVVGGMQQQHHQQQQQQQQHRLVLAVSVLELPPCSRNPGNENGHAVEGTTTTTTMMMVSNNSRDDAYDNRGGLPAGDSSTTTTTTAESSAASPCSAFPPLSPSPSPHSPVLPGGSSPVSSKNSQQSCALSKLGRRVTELRSRLARNGLHRRWWQRYVLLFCVC